MSVSGGTVTCGSGYCSYYDVEVTDGNTTGRYTIVNGGYDSISAANKIFVL
ncbi:hypothetical protein L3i20_v224240 [Paenibacillus sp. L3-i20]|nr:hypothetical protein L3i20_v224240 [Paenibacillus sp. L3-i20]